MDRMETGEKLITAREFLWMPDGENRRTELIAGKVKKRQSAWWIEGLASTEAMMPMWEYVSENDLGLVLPGMVGYHIKSDPDHVRVPSIGFISNERLKWVVDKEDFFPGAPDIAFENVTVSDTYCYMNDKISDWFEADAKLVIVLNAHDKSATVYSSRRHAKRLIEGDTLDGGDVLPGWSIPVADIFK